MESINIRGWIKRTGGRCVKFTYFAPFYNHFSVKHFALVCDPRGVLKTVATIPFIFTKQLHYKAMTPTNMTYQKLCKIFRAFLLQIICEYVISKSHSFDLITPFPLVLDNFYEIKEIERVKLVKSNNCNPLLFPCRSLNGLCLQGTID